MANKEHLRIFRQGIKVWNQWRKENPKIRPNLNGVVPSGMYYAFEHHFRPYFGKKDLREANLVGTDLSGTDLSEADLSGTDLSGTDLRGANLRGAKMCRVRLQEAILLKANLSEANLTGAILQEANLNQANLTGAILSGVKLREANLSQAIFKKTDLREIDLSRKDLTNVDFSEANIMLANLSDANLSGANLSKTKLQNVNLQTARLINSNLDEANLTGAHLWETQRAGWSIKGIICESVFWDKEAKEKTEYTPGEFERLFSGQTKIKLFYKDGISPLEIATLPALIQHLEDVKGCSLRFVSITESAGGAVVELAIENTEDLSQKKIESLTHSIKESAKRDIQTLRNALKDRDFEVKLLTGKVEGLKESMSMILKEGKGDTYHISGQAGAVGPNAHAHNNTFNQLVNQFNQSIDLATLAKELSELRQAIKDKQDSSPQADIALGKVAEAEIAASEKDTAKVVEHLKAAGKWTLDFAKEIGKDVVVVVIKQAMEIK
jgi:uncharacterized protein YjbI with pentapeptide repeats